MQSVIAGLRVYLVQIPEISHCDQARMPPELSERGWEPLNREDPVIRHKFWTFAGAPMRERAERPARWLQACSKWISPLPGPRNL